MTEMPLDNWISAKAAAASTNETRLVMSILETIYGGIREAVKKHDMPTHIVYTLGNGTPFTVAQRVKEILKDNDEYELSGNVTFTISWKHHLKTDKIEA